MRKERDTGQQAGKLVPGRGLQEASAETLRAELPSGDQNASKIKARHIPQPQRSAHTGPEGET